MVVTTNPPPTRGFVSKRASPGPLREPLCAHSAPAPDKTVRPTVSSRSSQSWAIDAIAHRDETDHRIVQQLGGRALLDRNSLGTGPRKATIGGGRVRVYANRPPDRTPSRHFTRPRPY